MAIDAWRASLIIETWGDMQHSNTERHRSDLAIEAWRASFKLIVIETWEGPPT